MNMVKAEFYKLKKSKPFWVCLCVCIFMAALLPFALSQAVASGEPDVQDLSLSAVEITSYAFSMPILNMVAAVFTSIFVSGEFTHGTMKNYVSKGLDREELFATKFLACAVAVTLMMAVFVPVILLSGTIFLGFDPHGVFSLSAFIGMLLTVWLLMMAYTAVFTAIGMALRSNGASIGVNICLVSIFPTLLSAADFIFKRIGFQISTGWISTNLSAVATLTPASGALLTGILVGCVWLMLGIIGGAGMFRRQDIK